MSIINVSKEELFNIMQYINLIKIKFEKDSIWRVFPILYTYEDGMDILIDLEFFDNITQIGTKFICKFQKCGCDEKPTSLSIKFSSASKFLNLRQSIRFDTNIKCNIFYKDDTNTEKTIKGIINNLSKGGASITTENSFYINEFLNIKINFQLEKLFETKAKIVRKNILENDLNYLGLKFIETTQENKDILTKGILKFEKIYLGSLEAVKEFELKNKVKYDVRIVIFSNDPDESYDIREALIKLNAQNFDVVQNVEHYKEFISEINPKIIIFDTKIMNEEIIEILNNIQKNHIEKDLFLIVPIDYLENQEVFKDLKNIEIMYKPLISDEFKDMILKYL